MDSAYALPTKAEAPRGDSAPLVGHHHAGFHRMGTLRQLDATPLPRERPPHSNGRVSRMCFPFGILWACCCILIFMYPVRFFLLAQSVGQRGPRAEEVVHVEVQLFQIECDCACFSSPTAKSCLDVMYSTNAVGVVYTRTITYNHVKDRAFLCLVLTVVGESTEFWRERIACRDIRSVVEAQMKIRARKHVHVLQITFLVMWAGR